ncbi:hypothetical protein KYC5002_07975 [Archangium violaceum]|nr:hypothetical protein KYC5002_07975 [Archangium gephyra]
MKIDQPLTIRGPPPHLLKGCIHHRGPEEVRLHEARLIQHGSIENGVVGAGAVEPGPAKVGPGQPGSGQLRPRERRSREENPGKIDLREPRSLQPDASRKLALQRPSQSLPPSHALPGGEVECQQRILTDARLVPRGEYPAQRLLPALPPLHPRQERHDLRRQPRQCQGVLPFLVEPSRDVHRQEVLEEGSVREPEPPLLFVMGEEDGRVDLEHRLADGHILVSEHLEHEPCHLVVRGVRRPGVEELPGQASREGEPVPADDVMLLLLPALQPVLRGHLVELRRAHLPAREPFLALHDEIEQYRALGEAR